MGIGGIAITMKLRVWAATIVLVVMNAAATDQEQYVEFAKTQVFSEDFPNSAAQRMIVEGIGNDDPVIVDLTIYAMSGLAEARIMQMELQAVGMLAFPAYRFPDRALSEVPGLRDFLIRHFEQAYDRWDGQSSQSELSLPSNMDELSDSEREAAWFNRRTSRAAWMGVPDILSLNWPGDQAVHDFLLGGRLLANSGTVQLLNLGGFVTPGANALRLQVLAQIPDDVAGDDSVERYNERYERYLVARGLALSQAPEAVPHLIAAAASNYGKIPTVLRLLALYEADQLMPFQSELRSLLTSDFNDLKGVYPKLESVANLRE